MNIRELKHWCYETLSNYNIFTRKNDHSNNNISTQDTSRLIRHQKFASRLYIILLICEYRVMFLYVIVDLVSIYVIFFLVFVNNQTKVITISNMTETLVEQLQYKHGESLSCSCSNAIISYQTFVSIDYSLDSICSSYFISDEWIKSLYTEFASSFLVMDFRTTGYSQVKMNDF